MENEPTEVDFTGGVRGKYADRYAKMVLRLRWRYHVITVAVVLAIVILLWIGLA